WWIGQNRNALRGRYQLFKQVKPFSPHRELEHREPSDVAARPRQALDETLAHRVGDIGKHDRQHSRRLHQSGKRGTALSNDEISSQLNKWCCQGLQTAHIALGPAIINPNTLPLGPSQALEFRCECCELSVCLRVGFTNKHQYADAAHPLALLRARRQRPRRRAADERDELATLHSITWSARCWRNQGTSRPSALAVLRLITRSYLVGACTGR